MSLIETKGIVIKAQDYKENDKLLWIYTEKLGKVTAIAKGAKKSKNKSFSITLPLCYSDYLLFKGKNLYRLSEGKIINSFQGLLNNLEKLTYSSYLCELIDISTEDGEKNPYLFKEFLRAFELKVLKATGYEIDFNNCVFCKKKINSSNYISLSYYGGVCEECPKEHGVYLSRASFNALRFLNTATLDKVYRVNLNEEMKEELFKINSFIISSNYVRKPKSLEMLKFI